MELVHTFDSAPLMPLLQPRIHCRIFCLALQIPCCSMLNPDHSDPVLYCSLLELVGNKVFLQCVPLHRLPNLKKVFLFKAKYSGVIQFPTYFHRGAQRQQLFHCLFQCLDTEKYFIKNILKICFQDCV